jgi:hypothetical protein
MKPRHMIVKSLVVGGLALVLSTSKEPAPPISSAPRLVIKVLKSPLPPNIGRDLCGLDCGGLFTIRRTTAVIRKVRLDSRTGTILRAP